jgi:hypothetical protein
MYHIHINKEKAYKGYDTYDRALSIANACKMRPAIFSTDGNVFCEYWRDRL